MKFVTSLLITFLTTPAHANSELEVEKIFADANVKGTLVIRDLRPNGQSLVYNESRANKRYMPASTFKIAHALIALDAGIVNDEFQVFPWDGKKRSITSWNQDQDLRSSIRVSALWLYQQWAEKIGVEKEQKYLELMAYGNTTIGKDVSKFWIDDSLKISANEQIDFLEKLYKNQLPFDVADQRLIKDLMVNEAGYEWILRAKSGWGATPRKSIGWWVGWVEKKDGPVFFALNIDMPNGTEDASKRKSIPRKVLKELGVLH